MSARIKVDDLLELKRLSTHAAADALVATQTLVEWIEQLYGALDVAGLRCARPASSGGQLRLTTKNRGTDVTFQGGALDEGPSITAPREPLAASVDGGGLVVAGLTNADGAVTIDLHGGGKIVVTGAERGLEAVRVTDFHVGPPPPGLNAWTEALVAALPKNRAGPDYPTMHFSSGRAPTAPGWYWARHVDAPSLGPEPVEVDPGMAGSGELLCSGFGMHWQLGATHARGEPSKLELEWGDPIVVPEVALEPLGADPGAFLPGDVTGTKPTRNDDEGPRTSETGAERCGLCAKAEVCIGEAAGGHDDTTWCTLHGRDVDPLLERCSEFERGGPS